MCVLCLLRIPWAVPVYAAGGATTAAPAAINKSGDPYAVSTNPKLGEPSPLSPADLDEYLEKHAEAWNMKSNTTPDDSRLAAAVVASLHPLQVFVFAKRRTLAGSIHTCRTRSPTFHCCTYIPVS